MDKALGVPNEALGDNNEGRLSDVLLDAKIDYEKIDEKIKNSIGMKPIAYDDKEDYLKEMIRAWNKEGEEKGYMGVKLAEGGPGTGAQGSKRSRTDEPDEPDQPDAKKSRGESTQTGSEARTTSTIYDISNP